MKNNERKWTTEEELYLKQFYGKLTRKELAYNLNRTKSSVAKKAERMQIKSTNQKKPWYKEEIIILRKNYKLNINELSNMIPRHPSSSIIKKMYELQLYKSSPETDVNEGNLDIKIDKWNRNPRIYRKIAEIKIGRKLNKGEAVHHIDCDNSNNNPDNLYIFPNHTQHARAHFSINRLIKDLIRLNYLRFNKNSGMYEIVEK